MTPEQARKVLAAAPAGSVYAEMAQRVLQGAQEGPPGVPQVGLGGQGSQRPLTGHPGAS